MINYSIAMLSSNPADKEAPKKAYAVAQYSEKMTLAQFSEHISSHNSVYDAEDVQAILGKAVKCLREMLLEGKKVELGKLGEFSVTLRGKGADTPADFNPQQHVSHVNIVWTPGQLFGDLKRETAFQLVASRSEQKEAVRKVKAGDAGGDNPGGTQPGGDDSGTTDPGLDDGDE